MQMCADLFYSCGFNVTLEPSFKILNCEVFSHLMSNFGWSPILALLMNLPLEWRCGQSSQ